MNWSLPYHSRRSPVCARNVVTTSQPLAAQAGLFVLREGGNAVDAAIATAAALTVVEPTSNGLGSDAFAIVWDGSSLHGLNASGRSSANLTIERLRDFSALADRVEMPKYGWLPVTVPGAISAWVALHERFGKLPFDRVLAPAIEYAAQGFCVSPIVASGWRGSVKTHNDRPTFVATFGIDESGPQNGQFVRLPDHAKTLREIVSSKGESFYRDEIAKQIVDYAKDSDGLFTLDDFSTHQADWVTPIRANFGDVELHEIPPNGQGIATLIALNQLDAELLRAMTPDSADAIHLQIEAMKIGLSAAYAEVADPTHMRTSIDELLARREPIDANAAASMPRIPQRGGTVYLTAADASGMMVSFIQSNFWGFGSGVVVPGTGIAMQNRGYGFSFDPTHPNFVGPRKRPFHTIIPAFVTALSGEPLCAFGVMGGAMQAQGHLQMVTRMFAHDQNPQAALDAPRWRVMEGYDVLVEDGLNPSTLNELKRRGHVLKPAPEAEFGGGQIVVKTPDGYVAGSDWRKDGAAVGY